VIGQKYQIIALIIFPKSSTILGEEWFNFWPNIW